MKLFTIRQINLFSFFVCSSLLIIAAYLQYDIDLKPCPLCVIQRAAIITLGLLFLMGGLLPLKQRSHQILQIIILAIASLGALVAGKHVWIEHLPPNQIADCGASLKTLFSVLPFKEALQNVFAGTGHCAEVTWRLLGFSIPSWTLLFFITFALVSLWQGLRKVA